MRNLFFILALIMIFLSCTDKNDVDIIISTDQLDLNLITGLDIKQDEISETIRLGNPNIYTNQSIVYPNPSTGNLNIKTNNLTNINSVWIVNGNQEKIYQSLDFDTILNSNLYPEQQLSDNSVLEFLDNSSTNLLLNLESLPEGYYKVFINVNGNIEWHNIYKGSSNVQSLIDFWNN